LPKQHRSHKSHTEKYEAPGQPIALIDAAFNRTDLSVVGFEIDTAWKPFSEIT